MAVFACLPALAGCRLLGAGCSTRGSLPVKTLRITGTVVIFSRPAALPDTQPEEMLRQLKAQL